MSPLLLGGTGHVIHAPWRGAHPTVLKQPALQMGSSPTANPLGCSSGRQGEWTEIGLHFGNVELRSSTGEAGGTDRPLRQEERSSAFLCTISEFPENVLKIRSARHGVYFCCPSISHHRLPGLMKNHYPKSPRDSHPGCIPGEGGWTQASATPSAGPSGVRPCPD